MLTKSFVETNPFIETALANNIAPLLAYKSVSESTKSEKSATTYLKGETIMSLMGLGQKAFVVKSGEVVILQNGRPVDLVESGEYFDESIWLGAEAVALTDCTVVSVSEPQPLLLEQ